MKKHGRWEGEITPNSIRTSGWIINVGDVCVQMAIQNTILKVRK